MKLTAVALALLTMSEALFTPEQIADWIRGKPMNCNKCTRKGKVWVLDATASHISHGTCLKEAEADGQDLMGFRTRSECDEQGAFIEVNKRCNRKSTCKRCARLDICGWNDDTCSALWQFSAEQSCSGTAPSPTPPTPTPPTPTPPTPTPPSSNNPCLANRRFDDGRIVGGETTEAREFQFMVSLQDNTGFHYCGGSLIAPGWVLTAAHCGGSHDYAVIGAHDITDPNDECAERIQVAQTIKHAKYSPGTEDFDIALIRLKTDSAYPPVHLSFESADDQAGVTATVAGWGTLEAGGSSPDELNKVDVDIFASNQCGYRSGDITKRMLCAGVTGGGKDSCQGDSGGPLFVTKNNVEEQIGIVSWGIGCAEADYKGVYTKVRHFKNWICRKTGITHDQCA